METVFGISMNTIMFVVLVLGGLVLAGVGFFAWRNPLFLRLALRNIPRRKAQTVLIVVGLMLATLLITAAFGTGDTMTYSMRQAFTAGLGGTDIAIQKINPVIAFGGPPDFNRAQPTFDQSLLDDIRTKVGNYDLIDGWSTELTQIGPLVDTTTNQGSGQTSISGVDASMNQTMGLLGTLSGGTFDPADLKPGDILLDKNAADKLAAKVGDTVQVVVENKPTEFKVGEIIEATSPTSQIPMAFVPLAQMQDMYNAPGQVSAINISLKGGPLDGLDYSDEVTDKLKTVVDTQAYEVNAVKQGALDVANLLGNLFTTIFLGTSLFSVAAGIMLIFLIFTMLAAERKKEMGMARAVGTQRGHLTQMFIFEGLAYDLAAAAVGAALGVAVGFFMVGVISGIFGTYGFTLTPHIEVRSLVVAYCLGMLVTFLTVAVSAVRVSNLNIVAAIRDIPDMPKSDKRLIDQLTGAFDLLGQGQFFGFIGALISVGLSLFFSGPVAGGLGLLLMAAGWWLEAGFLFHTGATLFIIGLGFTIRWVLARRGVRPIRRNRIAFTITGLLLMAYWAMPINALHDWFGLPEFGLGIEYFVVAGLAMVAGAVWVVIYNADILLGAMSLVLGRVGRMRPVLKTAVAYPMSSIFRTGMAVAMFALIMFVLILMSVLTQVDQQVDPNRPEVTGGYQIQGTASFSNPIPDINAAIAANPELNGKFESITGQSLVPLEMRQVSPAQRPPAQPPSEEMLKSFPALAEGWRYYNARVVDDEFLKSNGFKLQTRAEGYDSDREVWDAVAADPSLVVIDYLPVIIGQSGGGGGGFGGAPTFYVTGVNTGNPTMQPVEIEMRVPGLPNAQPAKVKIVGVLSQDATSSNATGLYVNRMLTGQVTPMPVPVGTYLFRVKPGEDVQQVRRDLGSAFLANGMEPVVISDQIRQQQALGNSLTGLLQGFMALGLLVGVAALGVISTRAVVERRQQIGVLRAIGYQRSMVGTSFLLESSFIAMLGILIGVVLGLLLSYNFVQFFAEDSPTIQWNVPWLQILGIVALAYIVSLITTVVPARQAAQIYPAEALRYDS